MPPKITVCIVTYNQGEMLREAISSVINQTYRDMKIVVLDDASTDCTPEIAASFGDPRLVYIRHERNIGALNNWNYAIDCAGTEYVNVFHGDDRMFPWMIEKLVGVLENNPTVGMAASGPVFFMGSEQIPAKRKITAGKHFKALGFVEENLKRTNYTITAPSITIRKKKFDDLGIRFRTDIGPAADTYFLLEANALGIEIFATKEPLHEYRLHKASWTNKSGFDKWFDSLRKVEDLVQRVLPGADMSTWRRKYAKWLLGNTFTISNPSDVTRQRRLTDKRGWRLSDEDFLEALLSSQKEIEAGYSLKAVKELLQNLFYENNWFFSDDAFNNSALRNILRESVKQIGTGQKTFRDYRKLRADMTSSGLKIPLHREINWFMKYVPIKKHVFFGCIMSLME